MKTLSVNAKTGESKVINTPDMEFNKEITTKKGINQEKLKELLLSKGIINKYSDIE